MSERMTFEPQPDEAARLRAELDELRLRMNLAVESVDSGLWEFDAAANVVAVSSLLKRIVGLDDAACGSGVDWRSRIHPDDLARLRQSKEDVLAGRSELHMAEYRIRARDGSYRWILTRGRLIRGGDGRPLRMVGLDIDITERKRAEEALQENERRLADIAANLPGVVYRRVLYPDGQLNFHHMSERAETLLKAAPVDFLALRPVEHHARRFVPEDRQPWLDAVRRSAAELTPFDFEGRVVANDGDVRWVRSIARPRRQSDGTVIWDGVSLDVTEQKLGELALQEETRTLETIGRINTALAAELDLDKLAQAVTDAGTELTGAEFGALYYRAADGPGEDLAPFAVSGLSRAAFVKLPIPRSAVPLGPHVHGDGVIRVADLGREPRFAGTSCRGGAAARRRVRSYLAVPIRARSGEVAGALAFGHAEPGRFTERAERIATGIATQAAIAIDNAWLFRLARDDLRERERVEEHQNMLMAELDHRVKNTLAAVQAIANQTLSPGPRVETFKGRLSALAHAHSLLADSRWQGARLHALVAEELAPYRDPEARRVSLAGDEVMLAPKASQALALAMHELATNAAKYGALSVPDGLVEVVWKIADTSRGRRLFLHWAEHGGPPVKPRPRRGFGSNLVEHSVNYDLDGRVRLRFLPGGVRCDIAVPLENAIAANVFAPGHAERGMPP